MKKLTLLLGSAALGMTINPATAASGVVMNNSTLMECLLPNSTVHDLKSKKDCDQLLRQHKTSQADQTFPPPYVPLPPIPRKNGSLNPFDAQGKAGAGSGSLLGSGGGSSSGAAYSLIEPQLYVPFVQSQKFALSTTSCLAPVTAKFESPTQSTVAKIHDHYQTKGINGTGEVIFTKVDTAKEIAQELGVEISGSFSTGSVSGSAAGKWINEAKQNSRSINLLGIYNLAYTVQANAAALMSQVNSACKSIKNLDDRKWCIADHYLNGTAALLYAQTDKGNAWNDPTKNTFYQQCGDSFVSQMQYGAKLAIRITIETASSDDKKALEGELKGELKGVGSIAGKLKSMTSNKNSTNSISVSVMQLGGQPNQLIHAIANTQSDNGMYEFLNCGNAEHPDACLGVINAAFEYAKQNFSEQLGANDAHNGGQPKNGFYSYPVAEKYALAYGAVVPNSDSQKAAVAMLDEYDYLSKDLIYVQDSAIELDNQHAPLLPVVQKISSAMEERIRVMETTPGFFDCIIKKQRADCGDVQSQIESRQKSTPHATEWPSLKTAYNEIAKMNYHALIFVPSSANCENHSMELKLCRASLFSLPSKKLYFLSCPGYNIPYSYMKTGLDSDEAKTIELEYQSLNPLSSKAEYSCNSSYFLSYTKSKKTKMPTEGIGHQTYIVADPGVSLFNIKSMNPLTWSNLEINNNTGGFKPKGTTELESDLFKECKEIGRGGCEIQFTQYTEPQIK